ncbi:MAG: hypothetical protein MR487_04075 [Lachnospiraceae bacterium]|nr:hypothetical protein [Lachnospiraceae bacterium]
MDYVEDGVSADAYTNIFVYASALLLALIGMAAMVIRKRTEKYKFISLFFACYYLTVHR